MEPIDKVKKILLHKNCKIEFAGLMVPFDDKDNGSILDLKICLYVTASKTQSYDLFLDLIEAYEEDITTKYNSFRFHEYKDLIYGLYDFEKEEYVYKRDSKL